MALGGLACVLAGVVGYFVVVLHFAAWLPEVRNDAVPNWLLVGLGLVLSALAATRSGIGRRTARWLLAIHGVLAGVFAVVLYVASVVPAPAGPRVGVPAPDFSLMDQSGKPVQLADFRGSPLLLVFYRGHW